MPRGCVVPNCGRRYGSVEKVSMYRFPLCKPKLLERWLKAIKKPNWAPTKNSRICNKHFDEDCFWMYNGKNALTPYAIPSKFDAVPKEPKRNIHVSGQRVPEANKSWHLPSEKTVDTEAALITQDFVYIKTEPDLYLPENGCSIKEEPQSEAETEPDSYGISQAKVENGCDYGGQEPLPIVFPVVKLEVKEEPEDNTYSLLPNNFAGLCSTPSLEKHMLNKNLDTAKKITESKQTLIQRPPKKQRRRKRRLAREEGLLSDHTYVKVKLGENKMKINSAGNAVNHGKDTVGTRKYSDMSVQCDEQMLAQVHDNTGTLKIMKANNSVPGLKSKVAKTCTSEISKKCGTNVNLKKPEKISPLSSKKRISKFPSVTFSNNKCKNSFILNEKQRKVCKKLLDTLIKNDLELNSGEKEITAEEDFNKENTLYLNKCYNESVFSCGLLQKPHHTLDTGLVNERKNEYLDFDDIKKYNSKMFCSIKTTENKLCTSLEIAQKHEPKSNQSLTTEDTKCSDSLPMAANNAEQKLVVPVKRNKNKYPLASKHRKKKKITQSLIKNKNSNVLDKMKQDVENDRLTGNISVATNEMENIDICADSKRRPCPGEQMAMENDLNEEAAKPLLCVLCDELFPCQQSLRIHVATHCQESAFACMHCAKAFKDNEGLRQHLSTHRLHICVLCNAEFPTNSALCEHVLAHFGETVLKCMYCPKTFYGTKLYEEHQLLHVVVGEYACKMCDAVVGTEVEHLKHMQSHVKQEEVSESNVTVPFPHISETQNVMVLPQVDETKNLKDKHISLSENSFRKGHICPFCNKLCVDETEYRKHLLRHRNTNNSGHISRNLPKVYRVPVKCMLCGKKFPNELLLKKHILMHTGEIQQICGHAQDLDR